ncbi:MAG: DUF4276 family protein [Verrucomicrobiota bacterium]|jgi:hypothetical protein|nr:DUF4276 family protein [Verrucomicrobiota bacterium]
MSEPASVTVVALVEGRTEEIFIQSVVSPHLAQRNIFIMPILFSKPGEKGGDVKFARAQNDIGLHLKQRQDTYLTTFFDFYGVAGQDWPGYGKAVGLPTPEGKAACINAATRRKVNALFGDFRPERRFIPFVAVHEFEALLFSDPAVLASHLHVSQAKIEAILSDCGSPEAINQSPQTAPSKRLKQMSGRFKKTTTGIEIVRRIGLAKIRARCPLFGQWLSAMEGLKEARGPSRPKPF